MAIDSCSGLKPKAVTLLKARGAASPLEGLVRLLARQAACEAFAAAPDKALSGIESSAASKIR